MRIQQITVLDQDGNERAVWFEPKYAVELHSDDILQMLETLIEAIDDAVEVRNQINDEVSNIKSVSADASRELKRLGLDGGAQ